MTESNINVNTAAVEVEQSHFDGGVLEFFGMLIAAQLITAFTLGLCAPWALCMFFRWKLSHTVIGGRRLQFNGKGGDLFVNWIKWFLLCIVTLGIYGFWLWVSLEKWKTKNTSFAN